MDATAGFWSRFPLSRSSESFNAFCPSLPCCEIARVEASIRPQFTYANLRQELLKVEIRK